MTLESRVATVVHTDDTTICAVSAALLACSPGGHGKRGSYLPLKRVVATATCKLLQVRLGSNTKVQQSGRLAQLRRTLVTPNPAILVLQVLNAREYSTLHKKGDHTMHNVIMCSTSLTKPSFLVAQRIIACPGVA